MKKLWICPKQALGGCIIVVEVDRTEGGFRPAGESHRCIQSADVGFDSLEVIPSTLSIS